MSCLKGIEMPDDNDSLKLHTVKSLGREVSYNPETLFSVLRYQYPSLCAAGQDEHQQNIRIVMFLYRRLGCAIDPSIAGGVVQLVHSGRHVCNVVLEEYLRFSKKNNK